MIGCNRRRAVAVAALGMALLAAAPASAADKLRIGKAQAQPFTFAP